MAEHVEAAIACPSCGTRYRWAPQVAGRRSQCKCGAMLRLPKQAGGAARVEAPEDAAVLSVAGAARVGGPGVAVAPPSLAASGRCPSCGNSVKPAAIICVGCGFDLAHGRKLDIEVATADAAEQAGDTPQRLAGERVALARAARVRGKSHVEEELETQRKERMTEVYAPLILLGAGVLLILFNAFGLVSSTRGYQVMVSGGVPPVALKIGHLVLGIVTIVVTIPFFFIGILALVRLFGAAFGPLLTALLKLAGMAGFTVGTGAVLYTVMDIATGGYGGLGSYVTWPINVGIFWALAAWLLDLDSLEVLILYLIVKLLPAILMVFIGALIMA